MRARAFVQIRACLRAHACVRVRARELARALGLVNARAHRVCVFVCDRACVRAVWRRAYREAIKATAPSARTYRCAAMKGNPPIREVAGCCEGAQCAHGAKAALCGARGRRGGGGLGVGVARGDEGGSPPISRRACRDRAIPLVKRRLCGTAGGFGRLGSRPGPPAAYPRDIPAYPAAD